MSLVANNLNVIKNEKCILHNVSLELIPGELMILIGPNGAGKSTLLKALSGDEKLDNGTIRYNDIDLKQLTVAEQAQVRAVMSQSIHVAFDFLVQEIIQMGWVYTKEIDRKKLESIVEEIAKLCSVEHLLNQSFNALSGGEKQRVLFARTLLQIWQSESMPKQRYLLLDEPTSHLDLCHELGLLRLAKQQCLKGVGVIAVLHDLNLAARFADKIILLDKGEVVAYGMPKDVLTADRLTDIYNIPVSVEVHQKLQRLMIYT